MHVPTTSQSPSANLAFETLPSTFINNFNMGWIFFSFGHTTSLLWRAINPPCSGCSNHIIRRFRHPTDNMFAHVWCFAPGHLSSLVFATVKHKCTAEYISCLVSFNFKMFLIVGWILEGLFRIITFKSITSPRKEYNKYSKGDVVKAKYHWRQAVPSKDNRKVG